MKNTSTLLWILFSCWNTVNAQSFTPVHKIVFEDQTQCSPEFGQWSPRGIVYMDSLMRSPVGNTIEFISVHSSDGTPPDSMVNPAYSNGCRNSSHLFLDYGWPSVNMDRKKNSQMQLDSIYSAYNNHTGDFGVADINVTPVYDSASRILQVTAESHFAVDAVRYNLALVLTEDSVHGTSINYSQRNNYAANANGPMAGGGVDFAAQPDPVPASVMYYRNVARAILPFFTGASASLPDTAFAYMSYSYTFPDYTVPAAYNALKMRAIVLLIDSASGKIMNANGAAMVHTATGIRDAANGVASMSVFPNPFKGFTSIKFGLKTAGAVTLSVSNNLGQELLHHDMDFMNTGEHSLELNSESLVNGIYFATLKTAQGSVTKKVVVER